MIGGIHIQTHRENRIIMEELLEAVLLLRSDPKLYKENNSLLRAMVSSQSQYAKI
jgi:hypothetical protein